MKGRHIHVPVRALLAELPTGLLIGLTVVTATTMTVGTVIDAPLHEPNVALGLSVLLLVTAVAGAWCLSDRSALPRAWVGFIPTAWVLFVGMISFCRDRPDRTEWFLGGDNVRHLALVAEIVDTGTLNYSANAYPRAWHAALAGIWQVHHQGVDESSLLSFADLNATATWILFAGVVLATSNLAGELARHFAPRCARLESGAALLAGFAVMSPRFMADTMALGFQTSMLAAVILAVAARECVVRKRPLIGTFSVLVALVVLTSHTWQLLVPAVALPAMSIGWRIARDGWPSRVVAALMVTVGIFASLPPLVAAVTGPGVAAAGADGVVATPRWLVLCGSLIAAALLIRRSRARPIFTAVAVLVAPLFSAALLAGILGVSLIAYYPSKLMWHTAALGLSFISLIVVASVIESTQAALTVRLGGAIVGIFVASAVVLGLIAPFGAQMGAWSTVNATRVMSTASLSGAAEAQGVWMNSSTESAVTRTLMMTLRGELPSMDRLTVAEECAGLIASTTPTVITTHSKTSALQRYDCVDRLVVLTFDQ